MSKLPAVLLTFLALSVGACAGPGRPAERMSAPMAAIIPEPARLEPGEGVFILRTGARLAVPAGDRQAKAAAERFADLMQRTRGLSVTVRSWPGGSRPAPRAARWNGAAYWRPTPLS